MSTVVSAGDATIAYRTDGSRDGVPVLFLSSLGVDLSMWDEQVSALGNRFRCLRMDLRGHGGSSVTRPPYTIDLLARDATAVIDALGLDRVHVVGISLGGMLAIRLAASRPERVDRLVLASTAPRIGTAEVWQARADAVLGGGTAAVADLVMERFFSPAFRRSHPDVVARYREGVVRLPAEGYAAACLALRDADLEEDVVSIAAPTLVVAGGDDVSTPAADAEGLHAKIGASRLLVLPGAGHLCSVERPSAFSDAVGRFLAGEEVGSA